MQSALKGRGPLLSFALAASLLSTACGNADFGGTSQTRQASASGSADQIGDRGTPDGEFYAVGIAYQEDEQLSLVENALHSWKGDLVGGAACWGAQASPYSDAVVGATLKVRKGAANCVIIFKELNFREPGALTVKNSMGLRSDNSKTNFVDFADDNKTTSLSIAVQNGISTSADTIVQLAGRITRVVATESTVANEELNVSASGDVVAFPHVNVAAGPLIFKNTIRATMTCAARSATASACLPSILAQGNGKAGVQLLAGMDAAIGVLKGAASTGFPGTMTQGNLDSLFASKRMLNVAQGLSNIAPAVVNGFNANFEDMAVPAVAQGDKVVLIIRYYEVVAPSTSKTYTYKVFLLKI